MPGKPRHKELEKKVHELERIALKRQRVEKELLQRAKRYRTIFESTGTAIITGDEKTTILMVNSEFEKLSGFSRQEIEGKKSWTEFVVKDDLERLQEYHRLRRIDPDAAPRNHEFRFIDSQGNIRNIFATVTMLPGTKMGVSSFSDITDRKKIEEALERANRDLKLAVTELKNANQNIIRQQNSVIEEERLKVLLQIAGATAHELRQPLTVMLGNIELMGLKKDSSENLSNHIDMIKDACNRMALIIEKIGNIHRDEIKPYVDGISIINFDQDIKILSVAERGGNLKKLNEIIKEQNQLDLYRVKSIEDALVALRQNKFDLIFTDYLLAGDHSVELLEKIRKEQFETPVVVIIDPGDEMTAAKVIQAGAYDYLSVEDINKESLSRVTANALEKIRRKGMTKKARNQLALMSTKDELTGLFNRRHFDEVVESEVSRSRRYGNELVLCIIALDNLHEIVNDLGRSAGDMALLETAGIINTDLRQSDLCCRYGKDRFAIILPDTEIKKGYKVCKRVKEMVSEHRFVYRMSSFHCTVSANAVQYAPGSMPSSKDLVKAAERAI